jgi:RNA polymerase sigma-54 factor
MSLAPRLDLRQSQSLVMTPQLQQAIKLLALSNLELEGFLASEIEKNPLLDGGGEEGEAPAAGDDGNGDEGGEDGAGNEPATADALIETGDAIVDAPLDADYLAETFHHDSAADSVGPARDASSSGGDGEAVDFDSFAGAEVTLHDHLMAQAGQALSGLDLVIASQLVDQIDEAGYLSADLDQIARRMGVDAAEVDRVLTVVQGFDPSGVGARTLAECIAIQAREADRYDPCMAKLIDNLELLARGGIPALRRLCGVDEEDMADMIRELRGYDPKPGLRFGGAEVQAVVPDIFIREIRGGWSIELNAATLPRLLVNRAYYSELSSGAQDKSSKAWLSECLASANWLVKALDQRARTIVKVATEIVKQQDGFFRKGVEHLRPLTLKTVADAIGMHESTVSRVTSNKYLACARGTIELKYFFTSSIQASDGGDAVSAEAVKSHIAKLIAAEGPSDILSDDKLVELLTARGFDIARRTVAKYREAMGIGSSVQRRRQKAIGHAA